MSRISAKFSELRQHNKKGFIPFVSAGDPDLETSKQIVLALADSGADIIELGVPFSDPMADGPTIQASSMRALESGTNIRGILQMVREVRKQSDVPIVLFSYFNPLFHYGLLELSRDAAEAGADGVLVTDAVDEVAFVVSQVFKGHGLDLISLIAPTTSDERLERIAAGSQGFLYAVSRAGVTGASKETSTAARTLVERARKVTDMPIAVGFGISTRDQVEEVWTYADAAVVGSAIVAEIAKHSGADDIADRVSAFVRTLIP